MNGTPVTSPKPRLNIALLAAVSILSMSALLSGCVGVDVFTGAAPATPTATPAPTVTAIPGDVDGNGRLDEPERKLHAKSMPLDYTLPHGTIAVIEPGKPLPAAIVEHGRAVVKPLTLKLNTVDGSTQSAVYEEIKAATDKISADTLRKIVFVFETTSANWDTPGQHQTWAAAASGKHENPIKPVNPNRDQYVAKATEWATANGFEVIVID